MFSLDDIKYIVIFSKKCFTIAGILFELTAVKKRRKKIQKILQF